MSAAEARYHRARLDAHRAWQRSNPQYVIPGVLEEADGFAHLPVGLLEPAHPVTPRGGLNKGAEPCHRSSPTRGLTATSSPTVAAPARSGASAPLQFDTRGGANPPEEKRAAPQKGL